MCKHPLTKRFCRRFGPATRYNVLVYLQVFVRINELNKPLNKYVIGLPWVYELHRVTFSTLIMCNKGVCQTWITYFKSSSWVQERAIGGSSILGYCIGFWWRGGHFCICLRWKCINQNYGFYWKLYWKIYCVLCQFAL